MTKPIVEGFCDPAFSSLEEIFAKAINSGFDDGAGLLGRKHNQVCNLT